MNFLKATGASLLGYLIPAILLFGNPLHPIAFLTFWSDRLAVVNWPAFLAIGLLVGLVCAALGTRFGMNIRYTPALFALSSMVFSTTALGVHTEHRRSEIIDLFDADVETRASFFVSLRSAPREFQFFLHGAALKDCVPYAWSYRNMEFYQLPSNVAVNVLPQSWVDECQIQQTD